MTAPWILSLLLTIGEGAVNPADQAWEAYLSGDFTLVDNIAAVSLNDSVLSPQAKSRIYIAWGCAEALRNRKAAAAAAFERAFNLNPDLHYTAADLPPPVWQVFQLVQERLGRRSEPTILPPISTPAIKEVIIHDTVRVNVPVLHQPAAILKSLAWPGWGHIDEGKSRGWTLAAVQAGVTAGFIGSLWVTIETRDDYLSAREEGDITRKFNRYNDAYRAAWVLGAAALTSYLYTQWDFFSSLPPPLRVELTTEGAYLTAIIHSR
ncbi:MAG: hypothetical protein V2A61_05905 [Calditrichota bacterium]